jgi:hypothetical protein
MNDIGHNWLASLAADIRALHAGIRRNAEQIARDAIEAGKLLIEAKQALGHGQWEQWLRDNCNLSTRTARRYMALSRSGLKSATVADLGLAAAAKAIAAGEVHTENLLRAHGRLQQSLIEIGRHFAAVHDEIGEEQFRSWAPVDTGFSAGEALFLAGIARSADAGADVNALFARDDAPKEWHVGSWRASP